MSDELRVQGRLLTPGRFGAKWGPDCGPCDVTVRFAQQTPGWRIDAADGAPEMLKQAAARIARVGLQNRLRTVRGRLPNPPGLHDEYEVILSTNLLHHLHDRAVLWESSRRHAKPGSIVFVADPRRSRSREEARELVGKYAAGEPAVLRRDFYNSLLAAFTPAEVEQQLAEASFRGLRVEAMDDRHLLVHGVV